ncbi:enoyl-CoA hydratase [Sphingomonas sp. QA11]|uniref:enoyl-CoA hydratase n=1 Tax=Sphingomonas sp. QA11 TaxID=2950605 RepID=UPI0023498D86|nr:enoyl-CoA hydratase [Sphingomonas sp. QA11]WCM26639.1 enoyl-CoA hydratase [Sphingomonas sp. QA11]
MSGQTILERDGAIARVRFDNVPAHNALTHRMWVDLHDICVTLANDPTVRVVTFRGTGGRAFISGTDISGFADFSGGQDGLDYENEIDLFMGSIDRIPATTIAIVEGWAVGGGINISSACDFRVATPNAKFGSPIGRTIGNCLSASSVARVGGAVGAQVAKRMVLLGEMITAQELLDNGFLYKIAEPEDLDAVVETLVRRAAENAPLTTRTTKETIRRLTFDGLPDIQQLISDVYGSNDFRRGVHDFLAKTKKTPIWTGD